MKIAEFVARYPGPGPEREAAILAHREVDHEFVTLTVIDAGRQNLLEVEVSARPLALVFEDRSLIVNVHSLTQQALADRLGALLLTAKAVDLIHEAARVRCKPGNRDVTFPGGGTAMMSTQWMLDHSEHCYAQGLPAGVLVSGCGKDFVLTNRLEEPDHPSANYGMFHNGKPLQPLGCAHNRLHTDYSQTARFMKRAAKLNGRPIDLVDLLSDPALACLLSSEGVIRVLRMVPAPSSPRPAPPALDPLEPVLRLGSSGPGVVRWQRIAGVTADGKFGEHTRAATRRIQAALGLTTDGVVGPRTWAAARAPTSAPLTSERGKPGTYKFVEAKHSRPRRRGIDTVVIHTAECGERPNSAEAVASYFRAPPVTASAHFCVDSDSVVQCVHEDRVAYAAPDQNEQGIQIELSGYARQSAEDWADPYSSAMLDLAAELVADLCARHSIPVEFVGPEGLKAGARGITTHQACTKAFPVGADGKRRSHWDPGNAFPMDAFLARVAQFMQA